MNKTIIDKKTELYNKWSYLKDLAKDHHFNYEQSSEIYRVEDETYKKYLFYRNYIRAKEKVEKYEKKSKKL